jgi:hypothetical protein
MADAALELSATLSGVAEAVAGLQQITNAATKSARDVATATVQSTQVVIVQQQKAQQAVQATTSSMGGLRQSATAFAATLSGTAALLSLFARNNEELKRQLEVVAVATGAAGAAMRVLGAATRFALTPIGAIVTAVAAAIAIFQNWDTVQRAVATAIQTVWKGVGTFFGQLFAGIGELGRGLGQILLGALTFNMDRVTAGVEQLRQGLGTIGQLGIDTGQQLAAGFKAAAIETYDFLRGLVSVKDEVKALADANRDAAKQILEAWEGSQNAVVASFEETARRAREVAQTQADANREEARQILEVHEATQNAILENTVARIAAENELERQKAAGVREAAIMTAQTVIGLARQVFGQQKAFAIAEAIINTEAAVTRTLRAWPWPLNAIFAAIVAALGATAIAKIAATKMAAGGIVTGPTLALIGEEGPEAVIPLTGRRRNLMLDGIAPGGRGNIEFHYHLEGAVVDEITWQRHIRRVARDLRRMGLGPGFAPA